jgi:hypothetical protein
VFETLCAESFIELQITLFVTARFVTDLAKI